MALSVRVTWNEGEYDRVMTSTSGPVGRYMDRLGSHVADLARVRCPKSKDGSYGRPAGYAAAAITHEVTRDAEGLHVDVISPATTPDGYPYPLGLEVGTVPHVITSHGDYPLRTKYGEVLGHSVHHPGTSPYPYLRPALAAAGGFAG